MSKHYTIEGAATLTPRVTEKQPSGALPALPGSITMDPAGIDLFHAIMQILFAHLYSPYRLPTPDPTPGQIKENRAAALAFLTSHRYFDPQGAHVVVINVDDTDAFITQYTLAHRGRRAPVIIRVDPRRGLDQCVAVHVPSGVFVTLDLRRVALQVPPGAPV